MALTNLLRRHYKKGTSLEALIQVSMFALPHSTFWKRQGEVREEEHHGFLRTKEGKIRRNSAPCQYCCWLQYNSLIRTARVNLHFPLSTTNVKEAYEEEQHPMCLAHEAPH